MIRVTSYSTVEAVAPLFVDGITSLVTIVYGDGSVSEWVEAGFWHCLMRRTPEPSRGGARRYPGREVRD